MPAPPPDVRTIDTLQGTRFVLPSHPLLRVAGLFPIAFGLFFSGFAVFWILGAAGALGSGGSSQSHPASIMSILFPLFGLPFFLVGLVPVGMGLTMLLGRPEFEIRGERFRVGPRFGPLHRSKWRPLDDLERFEINRFGTSGSALSGMHVLRAHVGEEKPLNITGSRDVAWLERLAQAITAKLERGELLGDPPQVITRDRDPDLEEKDAEPSIIPAGVADPGPPPANARVWAEQSPTGQTIFIPPRGFRGKPVPSLLVFAGFWLLLTNGIGAAFATGFFHHSGGVVIGMLFASLIILLFEAIGVGMLLFAISLAKRRAILDITDDGRTLLVTRSGLRKSSQREIAGVDIAFIQVQNSGTAINDKPLRQVTIKVAGADDIDLLTGAPESELTWLAEKLRSALATPTAQPSPATPPARELANA